MNCINRNFWWIIADDYRMTVGCAPDLMSFWLMEKLVHTIKLPSDTDLAKTTFRCDRGFIFALQQLPRLNCLRLTAINLADYTHKPLQLYKPPRGFNRYVNILYNIFNWFWCLRLRLQAEEGVYAWRGNRGVLPTRSCLLEHGNGNVDLMWCLVAPNLAVRQMADHGATAARVRMPHAEGDAPSAVAYHPAMQFVCAQSPPPSARAQLSTAVASAAAAAALLRLYLRPTLYLLLWLREF